MALQQKGNFQHLLERFRQREGLTLDRLARARSGERGTHSDVVESLTKSNFILRLSSELQASPESGLLSYIEVVLQRLDPADALVASFILRLRSPSGRPTTNGQKLQIRRRELLRAIEADQEIRGSLINREALAGSSISESTLRGKVENSVLERFANALNEPRAEDIKKLELDPERFSAFVVSQNGEGRPRPRVVVLGHAVTDFNFVIPQLPELSGSVQAHYFTECPGGKGLTQAVAASRLEMESSIICTLGDDERSRAIIAFLEAEGVDCSLVNTSGGTCSPVTAVVRVDTSGAFAIGWKNDDNLRIFPADIHKRAVADVIKGSDYLFVSFEHPPQVIAAALELAKGAGVTTIVTPSPPQVGNHLPTNCYQNIDYMVANAWELSHFTRANESIIDESGIEAAAKRLGAHGIRNIIIVHNQQSHAYISDVNASAQNLQFRPLAVPAWSSFSIENAGERDAFCAMLARSLHDNPKTDSGKTRAIYYATAAMACAGTKVGVAESMPTMAAVQAVIDQGNTAVPKAATPDDEQTTNT